MKKKSKIKVSVIVPVYNSEQYVKKTLLSILKQDFKDFEVLAIDDGSSDKSGKICDKLSKKYKNLRVYHTKNHGVCHARNIGIKKARGEYIAFCDNDDEFLPDLLKEVYMASKLDKQKARYNESQRASKHKSQKAKNQKSQKVSCDESQNRSRQKSQQADMLLYGRVRKYLDENEKLYDMRTDVPKEFRYYSKDQIFVNYSQIRGISDAVWTYFFKREVVLKHKIYFEDKLLGLGEDIIYITKFLNHTNNLVTVPKAYYIWNARTSHSHTYYKPKGDLEGKILGLKKERKLMKKHKVDKLNPKFYVKRLASYGSHIVATNHKIGKAKYELELKNYQKLHEMFKPYYDELNHLYPDIPESVQAYLILNKHYKALFNYMKFGIKAKEKLSNATNSLNNKHKIK